MQILLIRHGESEADILHVHEGRADFELTEKGDNKYKTCTESEKILHQISFGQAH